jgi:DNA-binding NarL/FixJ family response regulator
MSSPTEKAKNGTTNESFGVILVDDHAAVLRQITALLPSRYRVVATSPDGAGLAQAAAELQPDLIVLDISLPKRSGLAVAREVRASGCKARIVFLTTHVDHDYAMAAFEAGALAYVAKMRLALDVVAALDAVLAGKRFVSPCPELAEVNLRLSQHALIKAGV